MKAFKEPAGFDVNSTLVISDFPSSVDETAVFNLLCWVAPVIRVQRVASQQVKNGFCVVFCDPPAAERVAARTIVWPGRKGERRPLTVQRIERRPTGLTLVTASVMNTIDTLSHEVQNPDVAIRTAGRRMSQLALSGATAVSLIVSESVSDVAATVHRWGSSEAVDAHSQQGSSGQQQGAGGGGV
ncbi:unnamed protein product [Vitrella brassicaformis CCMP3155]|uniref:RRM domain-containing protein n=1 Tax=Vitrella brassicaformis (strain CCMP3155) TaxID=1169540 RepID=A0A0G4H5P9_VITBC|nr:unnamed protein product [Vitrella brassicaformis CCMP3155]|eukprot:CEM39140.1 unnamed protein product [Vitrella brassicaformis CCMP3155]